MEAFVWENSLPKWEKGFQSQISDAKDSDVDQTITLILTAITASD